jgi:serine/threonine protein kinase
MSPGNITRLKSPVVRGEEDVCPEMKFTDFAEFQFLQSGGFGKVYRALHIPTSHHVALKFFGYTAKKPQMLLIEKEIENMKIVSGMNGFIQLYDTILDSKMGRIAEKIHCVKYPIIVMEYLPMDIFTFISTNSLEGNQSQSNGENEELNQEDENANGKGGTEGRGKGVIISENFIRKILIAILDAMNHLHSLGYIHRDLKLENIMLTPTGISSTNGYLPPSLRATLPSSDDPSIVKIIDLGEMVKIPKDQTAYRMKVRPPGSLGYFAPETVEQNLNSPASDLFQIGCILYALLSGTSPFRSNLMHSVEGNYHPMTGDAWKEISKEAKDLVHCLLKKDPKERISGAEILRHPWILEKDTLGSNTSLGRQYVSRVTHLMLRQKLKKFFLRSDVLQDQRVRQESLHEILHSASSDYFPGTHCSSSFSVDSMDSPHRASPHAFFSRASGTSGNDEYREITSSSPHGPCTSPHSHASHASPHPSEFFEELSHKSFLFKLNDLKKRILNSLSPPSPRSSTADADGDCSVRGLHVKKSVSYEEFCRLMTQFDLSELANETIFGIFDIRHEDRIRMRDFLLTLMTIVDSLTLHHQHQHPEEQGSVCGSPHRTPHNLSQRSPRSPHRTPSRHLHPAPGTPVTSAEEDLEQSVHSTEGSQQLQHPAEIYFSLFDVDGSGTIDKHELQILFHLLLDDLSIDQPSASAPPTAVPDPTSPPDMSPTPSTPPSLAPSSGEMSDLYALIGDKDEISYEEFKIFYETIINSETKGATVGTTGGGVDYHSMIHILTSRKPTSQPFTQVQEAEEEHKRGALRGKGRQGERRRGLKRKKEESFAGAVEANLAEGPMTRGRQRRLAVSANK